MIKFLNGTVDNRHVCHISYWNNGTILAYVLNDDKTYDRVFIAEYDSIGGWDDPIEGETYSEVYELDATEEEINDFYQYLFDTIYKGKYGTWAKKGMIVEVTKGRKYPKGTRFMVNDLYEYTVPGTYGRVTVTYARGCKETGEPISVDAYNCIVVDWNHERSTIKV